MDQHCCQSSGFPGERHVCVYHRFVFIHIPSQWISYSLIVALITFAGTPPDLFSPWFINRFLYKQIWIFYQFSRAIGYGAIACCYIFLGDHLVLCGTLSIILLFLLEMCKTVPNTVGFDMNIRFADYQMYLSGERLENSSSIFSWFTRNFTSSKI